MSYQVQKEKEELRLNGPKTLEELKKYQKETGAQLVDEEEVVFWKKTEFSLAELNKALKKSIKALPAFSQETARFKVDEEYYENGDSPVGFVMFFKRLETPTEVKERSERETKNRQKAEAYERQKMKRLQKKLGKVNK